MINPRKVTCKVLEAIDDGILDPTSIAEMALNALSEDEVREMLRANDFIELLEDEDDE